MSNKAAGFWIGTVLFLALAIMMSIIMTIWAAYNTRDPS